MTPDTIRQHAEAEARRIAYESGDPGANNPRAVLALMHRAMLSNPLTRAMAWRFVAGEDLESALKVVREESRMPGDDETRRIVPSTPRLDALPKPATGATVDLGALASGFDATARQPGLGRNNGPLTLVFVSFAMPDAALARLVDQAAKADAILVLRGLVDNSLTQTASRVRQLIGSRRVAVQIDPQAFDRYAVTQTPSFVLVRDGAGAAPCTSGLCVPGNGYVIAAGDVSLDYALAFFQRSAPAFSKDAGAFLMRLKAPAG